MTCKRRYGFHTYFVLKNNLNVFNVQDDFVMPYLPPPPEMILATRNFPVDVPRLGAKVPYEPLEVLVNRWVNA